MAGTAGIEPTQPGSPASLVFKTSALPLGQVPTSIVQCGRHEGNRTLAYECCKLMHYRFATCRWHRGKDSNLGLRFWRATCCRYTTPVRMADRAGFEPAVPLRGRRASSALQLSTLPTIHHHHTHEWIRTTSQRDLKPLGLPVASRVCVGGAL